MKYLVEYETVIREFYLVDAKDKQDAKDNFLGSSALHSNAYDSDIIQVQSIEEISKNTLNRLPEKAQRQLIRLMKKAGIGSVVERSSEGVKKTNI